MQKSLHYFRSILNVAFYSLQDDRVVLCINLTPVYISSNYSNLLLSIIGICLKLFAIAIFNKNAGFWLAKRLPWFHEDCRTVMTVAGDPWDHLTWPNYFRHVIGWIRGQRGNLVEIFVKEKLTCLPMLISDKFIS